MNDWDKAYLFRRGAEEEQDDLNNPDFVITYIVSVVVIVSLMITAVAIWLWLS